MPKPTPNKKYRASSLPSVENLIKKSKNKIDLREVNLAIKDNTAVDKDLVIKKATPDTKKPVTAKTETKVLKTLLGMVMPSQAAQFLSAITTGDNKLGLNDMSPDIKASILKSVENAKKRTGKTSGGTQYIDYSPEVDKDFEGMSAGPGKMLSIDPDVQAATMVGRVSYKTNKKGETEIYDSYDFSKTDPTKANTLYKKIRNYAGEVLPDEGNNPNLIGVIPPNQELAFGTNTNGIMKTNFRKRYAGGTDMFGIQPLALDFQEETPAEKAARLRAEAKANKAAALVAQKQAVEDARLKLAETGNQKRAAGDVKEAAQRVVIDQRMQNTANVQGKTLEEVKTEANALYKENLILSQKAADKRARESNNNNANPNAAACRPGDALQKTLGQKLAYGSSGIDPSHYIPNPSDVMNDYNIMLAKTEAKANSNDWLPIVATVGGLLQQGIGMAGSFKKGVVSANGNNNVNSDVEVEGGEMYETPQGETGEFKGPSHENGGIPLEVNKDVPEGTKVYSDRLKVGNKTLAERKATRERQTANLEKIASNPLVDQAVKNATQRKMQAIQKEEAADLDFQEKVNNVQAMADTMVKAFGTGTNGVQQYANGGTIDPITQKAFDSWISASHDDLRKKYPKTYGPAKEDYSSSLIELNALPEVRKDFQTYLFGNKAGTKDADNNYSVDGDFGKTTNSFAKQYNDIATQYANANDNTHYDMYPGWKLDDTQIKAGTFKAPTVAGQDTTMALTPSTDNPVFDWKASSEVPDEVLNGKAGIGNENPVSPTQSTKTASKEGNSMNGIDAPATGDITKLIGNYLGMTAGIKTAAEQRSTDVTHTNVYANAGKDSQKMLNNAKQGIETNKAQAIVKAIDVGRAGKRGGRGSARGVNQMRSMDWLYDTALQSQIADISAKTAEQLSSIDVQKSGVAMSADQLKGQGQYEADMANEAAKDAYYTALGKGRNQFAEGLMQSGKDLNDMKENKLKWNIQKKSGSYLQGNDNGTFSNKDIEYTDASGKKVSIPRAEWEKLMTQHNKTKKK